MTGAPTLRAQARQAAVTHAAVSVLLLAAAIAIAPAKFARAGPVFAALAVLLLAGGAATARAAWATRARHGIALPGWSPFDRGWWAWDPPLRAFHWAMCAHALLLTWVLILAAVTVEVASGMKLPVALDQVVRGGGQLLTGFGAAVLVGGGGYLLTRRWAREVVA
jgi:hypothetical protein